MKDVFNFCILLLSALPVVFSARGRQKGRARQFVLPILLCLITGFAAFLFRRGGSSSLVMTVFSLLIFICAAVSFYSKDALCWLYETAVRSSAALLPMAAAFLLPLSRAHDGMLFGWPYVPIFVVFSLPAVLVSRMLSGSGAVGELALSEERSVSPCFLLLTLESGAPVGLAVGGPAVLSVYLLLSLAVSVFAQLLWSETALFASHLSAVTQQRRLELERVIALSRKAAETTRTVDPGAVRSPARDCAFPPINALMEIIREEAEACGAQTDIFLQFQELEDFSQSALCLQFDLLSAPVLRAASGSRDCKIRIRARESAGTLTFSAGCAGASLSDADAASALAAVNAAGGWAERSAQDGFDVLSLVLFRRAHTAPSFETERTT